MPNWKFGDLLEMARRPEERAIFIAHGRKGEFFIFGFDENGRIRPFDGGIVTRWVIGAQYWKKKEGEHA